MLPSLPWVPEGVEFSLYVLKTFKRLQRWIPRCPGSAPTQRTMGSSSSLSLPGWGRSFCWKRSSAGGQEGLEETCGLRPSFRIHLRWPGPDAAPKGTVEDRWRVWDLHAFRKFGGQRTSCVRTSRPPRTAGSSAWLRKWCLLASCITAEEEAANNEFCWSSSESSVSSCFLTQFLPRFNLFSRIRWTLVDFTLILLCSVWKTRCKPQTSLEFHFVLFFSLYDRTTSAFPWFIYYFLLASWKLAVCCSCPVYRNNSSSDPCK